ncbi:hypothetical protein TSAR_016048, partial [Trichomalopsis sarcophagae]
MELCAALNQLANDENQKSDTRHEAASLHNNITKLENVFMAVFWNRILSRFNITSKFLQKVEVDLSTANDMLASLIIYEINFQPWKMKLKTSVNYSDSIKRTITRKLRDSETQVESVHGSDKFRTQTFYVIIDKLITELNKRSEAYNYIINLFMFLTDLLIIDIDTIKAKANNLIKVYVDDLQENLILELEQFIPLLKLQTKVFFDKLITELNKRSEAYNYIINLFMFLTDLLIIDIDTIKAKANNLIKVYVEDLQENLILEWEQFIPLLKLQTKGFFGNNTDKASNKLLPLKVLNWLVDREMIDVFPNRTITRKLRDSETQVESVHGSDKFRTQTFYVIIDKLITELNKRSEAYNYIINLFMFLTDLLIIDIDTIKAKANNLIKVYVDDLQENLILELEQFIPLLKLQTENCGILKHKLNPFMDQINLGLKHKLITELNKRSEAYNYIINLFMFLTDLLIIDIDTIKAKANNLIKVYVEDLQENLILEWEQFIPLLKLQTKGFFGNNTDKASNKLLPLKVLN